MARFTARKAGATGTDPGTDGLGDGANDDGDTDNGDTDNGDTDNGDTDNGDTDNGATDDGATDGGAPIYPSESLPESARRRRHPLALILIATVVLIALVVGGATALGFATGWSKAGGGEVIVVRNGGFLDDNSFRQVIPPNSELTYTGLWSIDHPYPASQRYFKVSAAQNADSNEVINVPTKDGVLVGVEGTFYFQLSTDPAILEDFDNKFGTRSFPSGNGSVHAWDGDEGWNAFLAATLGNLVQNVLRQEIGNVTCADLVASCTLAQNATQAVVPTDGKGNQTIAQVQQAVNSGFAADVQNILGVPVLTNIQFALSKISLPDNVQQAINDAQGAFAGVTKAQAGLQQAAIDAQTNAKKQEGYNACPVCGQMDLLDHLPKGITTYAPGGAFAIGAGQSPTSAAAPAPAPGG